MNLTHAQITKYYGYAQSIAGDLGPDLFHHILCALPDNIQHMDAYIFRSMFNAWINNKSSFNKLYRIPDYIDPCDQEEIIQHHSKYDSFLLHKILLDLEIEGFDTEVLLYKEVRLTSNIVKVSKRIGVNRRTISKIVNFIEDEIRHRYADMDS